MEFGISREQEKEAPRGASVESKALARPLRGSYARA
jgi:hypothetical protein